MSLDVVRYESTPNPNAVKVWLNKPVCDSPRSYLRRDDAGNNVLAAALFDEAGATTLLFCGEWFTFNKPSDTGWPAVKRRIEEVLKSHNPVRNGAKD